MNENASLNDQDQLSQVIHSRVDSHDEKNRMNGSPGDIILTANNKKRKTKLSLPENTIIHLFYKYGNYPGRRMILT